MNIRDIENSLITELKTSFPEVLVQGFPEKPDEFILLHPIGALLVHYQGGSYSDSNSIGCITQESQKEFSITIVTRNLRSNNGAYEYLDRVKSVLTGFKPDECSLLKPTKDYFISEHSGIWQYGINFSLTAQNIQIY